MKEKLEEIRSLALDSIGKVVDLKELDSLRVKYLGKKGELTHVLRDMGKLSPEERPIIGQVANKIRSEIEDEIKAIKEKLDSEKKKARLEKEKIDISISTRDKRIGHRHPLLATIDELEDLFTSMGFTVVDGPEIETVENISSLNKMRYSLSYL